MEDKIKVFISWSKKKSMEYARITREYLEFLNPNLEIFFSEQNINPGDGFQDTIHEKIKEYDITVLCLTRENKKSPWLIYEAGYANALGKTVIPFLFDGDPDWSSWIDNPTGILAPIIFDESNEKFKNGFFRAFSIKDNSNTNNTFKNYISELSNCKRRLSDVDEECIDFFEELIKNETFSPKNPRIDARDKTAKFLAGFETDDLYKIMIKQFIPTGKYFWIYGRKNGKLISGGFANDFFNYLIDKANDDKLMSGIDLKILFLDPEYEDVEKEQSQHSPNIAPNMSKNSLDIHVATLKNRIKNNPTLLGCFKVYAHPREEVIIRVDNAILYTKIIRDREGYPQTMTGSNFEIFSAKSERGKEAIRKFEKVWNAADEFPNN